MVTQMWLLRFQMCAVVNRVAVPHLCLRHHHGKSKMPRVITITDGSKSVGDNITHQFTHPLAPSRSPFNSHRNAASPKPLLFSTFGFATANPECRVTPQSQTSQIFRRQLHAFTLPSAPPRSPFNSHRNATSPKRYKGNRANSAQRDCFFQIREHPMLPQQQPVSVTPHRMSCPCLVSFSVGHYDVLVSTPDSMFSVV